MYLNRRESIDVDVDLIKVDTQATHVHQKEMATISVAPPPSLCMHCPYMCRYLEHG
jgi:hypothetical protein